MTPFYAILFKFYIHWNRCEGGVQMETKLILIDIVVLAVLAIATYMVVKKVSKK